MSHDENRYALNGVFVAPAKGEVVATDGHRLHVVRTKKVKNSTIQSLMPRKGVEVLLAARKTAIEALAVTEASATMFLTDGLIAYCPIKGQFPNYDAVIPKVNATTTTLTVPHQILREAVAKVSAVAEPRNKPVMFSVNGVITLSASSQELGQAEVSLPGSYEGSSITIGLNSRYLCDVLDQVESDTVVIQMKGPLAPIRIDDGAFSGVVMPMRL
jgi:DNA polymerase-3 subunit beta